MRASQFFIATLKEAPADAEVVSHKLMLRAGMIKRLAAGIYTWMPMGLRVMRKVERIVREEMDRAGAIELFMPAVQPAELWQESGRWEKYGPELLRFKDRHSREFVIGPTHEEVITDVVRREIKSYRQLPRHFYQIQTKFRDEIRPRFGVMRGREFTMKDGYSFHASFADLEREYDNMYQTYSRIFTRLGLGFRAVAADTGSIGGTGSHEFHVLADSGEDAIAFCPDSEYAANVELAEAMAPVTPARCRHRSAGEEGYAGEDSLRGCRRLPGHGADTYRQGHRGDARGRWRGGILPAADPRRPRPQRNQGQQAAGPRSVPFRHRRRSRSLPRLPPRLHRPGRHRSPAGARHRRSHGGDDGQLRLRRQRSRLPPDRCQLGTRPARTGCGRRYPQRRRR